MAHDIYEHDSFVSYNGETAWHGLGTVIAGYPTLAEAWTNSGMDWIVEQYPVQCNVSGSILEVPEKMVNVRLKDKECYGSEGIPLGVVGADYQVVQNKEHWDGFVVPYAEHTKSKIETTGTLRNGRVVWFLLKNGEVEYVKDDVIHEYFLLASSHDGSLCTTIMNTPIRVVCNNTLNAAINGTKNVYKVRHHSNHAVKIEEIKKAMGFGEKFREKFDEVMTKFVALQMTESMMRDCLEEKIFPKPIADIDPALLLTLPKPKEKVLVSRVETNRQDSINLVMQLTEEGMGSDIPGVRGTAYGLYNAITEFFDHHGRTRKTENDNCSDAERNFESAVFGNSYRKKETSLNAMLTLIQ